MGLIVNKNEKGLYNLTSSISDECLSETKWITEEEAKKTLILDAFFNFIEKTIEIDMEFPSHYRVNGIINTSKDKPSASRFLLDAYRKENCDDIITDKYNEIIDKLNLDLPKLD